METGVNEPTTAASLCQVSQKGCMSRCRKNNWTKAGWYPTRFSSRPLHYRTNFHFPANFQEMLGACQRLIHMFCRPGEGIYMAGFLVNTFGCVVGVWCWRVPLAGRQVAVFLLRRLSLSTEFNHNHSALWLHRTERCVEHETSFLVQINYCDWFAWCMVTAEFSTNVDTNSKTLRSKGKAYGLLL